MFEVLSSYTLQALKWKRRDDVSDSMSIAVQKGLVGGPSPTNSDCSLTKLATVGVTQEASSVLWPTRLASERAKGRSCFGGQKQSGENIIDNFHATHDLFVCIQVSFFYDAFKFRFHNQIYKRGTSFLRW